MKYIHCLIQYKEQCTVYSVSSVCSVQSKLTVYSVLSAVLSGKNVGPVTGEALG